MKMDPNPKTGVGPEVSRVIVIVETKRVEIADVRDPETGIVEMIGDEDLGQGSEEDLQKEDAQGLMNEETGGPVQGSEGEVPQGLEQDIAGNHHHLGKNRLLKSI